MRWDSFFDDLESQFQAQQAELLRAEVAEGVRVERATETLRDRLLRHHGQIIDVKLRGGEELSARLGPVGTDYFCMESDRTNWVIRDIALRAMVIDQARGRSNGEISTIKFAAVLRAILRDRQFVSVSDTDGLLLAEGTLNQVGRDFLIVATHPRDEFVRTRSVTSKQLIPLPAIGWLQTTPR